MTHGGEVVRMFFFGSPVLIVYDSNWGLNTVALLAMRQLRWT